MDKQKNSNCFVERLRARYHFPRWYIEQIYRNGVRLAFFALAISILLARFRDTKILACILGVLAGLSFLFTGVFLAIFSTRCPHCGSSAPVSASALYCMHCGKLLEEPDGP